MLRLILFAIYVVTNISGLFLSNFCQIWPTAGEDSELNSTARVEVPEVCKNGSINVDWPISRVVLTFPNQQESPSSVCLRGSSDVNYIFTDNTEGLTDQHLTNIGGWMCTEETFAKDILLQIDGPQTVYFIWHIEYKVVGQGSII